MQSALTLSVLDLSPITQGSDASQSFRNSLALAQHAERLGFKRYWMAEHHNMPGVGSAATAVLLAYVGSGTRTIRLGAGGVMLPNHAPLVVAEQFGTLASLFPGRVDLGLGRAPGTDPLTARALRRDLAGGVDRFPEDVLEIIDYFSKTPRQKTRAVPGQGLEVPVWILGSSLFGAQLAAALGLPYAFASHFAPAHLDEAVRLYRATFQPSPHLDRPYVMAGFNVFAADSDEEARLLATSAQQAFLNLRSGTPTQLPPPVAGFAEELTDPARELLRSVLSCSAVGAPARVRDELAAFAERTGADEIIVASMIYDHGARLRSHEIVAEVGRELPTRSR